MSLEFLRYLIIILTDTCSRSLYKRKGYSTDLLNNRFVYSYLRMLSFNIHFSNEILHIEDFI